MPLPGSRNASCGAGGSISHVGCPLAGSLDKAGHQPSQGSTTQHLADLTGGCLLSCSLDYQDVVTDGFYDLHGDFSPELERDVFPSLAALRALKLNPGDKREVSRARSITSDTLPVASIRNLQTNAGQAEQRPPCVRCRV